MGSIAQPSREEPRKCSKYLEAGRTADCSWSNAGRQDDEAIELAFSKKKIEERKAWLASFQPGTYLDQSVDQISYADFVNKASHVSYLN